MSLAKKDVNPPQGFAQKVLGGHRPPLQVGVRHCRSARDLVLCKATPAAIPNAAGVVPEFWRVRLSCEVSQKIGQSFALLLRNGKRAFAGDGGGEAAEFGLRGGHRGKSRESCKSLLFFYPQHCSSSLRIGSRYTSAPTSEEAARLSQVPGESLCKRAPG